MMTFCLRRPTDAPSAAPTDIGTDAVMTEDELASAAERESLVRRLGRTPAALPSPLQSGRFHSGTHEAAAVLALQLSSASSAPRAPAQPLPLVKQDSSSSSQQAEEAAERLRNMQLQKQQQQQLQQQLRGKKRAAQPPSDIDAQPPAAGPNLHVPHPPLPVAEAPRNRAPNKKRRCT
jgi:hypothetical protein